MGRRSTLMYHSTPDQWFYFNLKKKKNLIYSLNLDLLLFLTVCPMVTISTVMMVLICAGYMMKEIEFVYWDCGEYIPTGFHGPD